MQRTYTDVTGRSRTLTFVEQVPYLIEWDANTWMPSTATRWRDADGSVLQIPDNAWVVLKIKFEDVK